MNTRTIVLRGNRFNLSAERALYWQKEKTLVVADPHFGKPERLRFAGIPVPPGITASDLGRLKTLIDRSGARRLIVLGDLFHAPAETTPHTLRHLKHWLGRFGGVTRLLISGNHDRGCEQTAAEIGFDAIFTSLDQSGFRFTHQPVEPGDRFLICGHLHPVVRLSGPGRQAIDLPGFWIRPDVAVLPAFGSFTGGQRIRPSRGDRVFVIAEGELFQPSWG